MGKITDWKPIENEYQHTKTPIATLAKANGVAYQTIVNHMTKCGIVRNPPSALVTTAETTSKVKEVTTKEVKELREAVLVTHRDDIQLNRKRLAMISERLDATTGLSNMQRLNALKTILQCQEVIIKLERQAHSIVEETPAPPPPVAIQFNVSIDPHQAYLEMIGKK